MDKRRITYLRILYYVVFSAAAVLLFINKFDHFKFLDVDMLWHIRVGEDIVRDHAITFANGYSWLEGTLWTQHEWLFDVLIYWVAEHAGVFAYLFIGLFVIGLTYAFPCLINKWKYRFISLAAYYYLYSVFKVNTINRPAWYSIFLTLAVMMVFDSSKLSGKKKLLSFFLLGLLISNFHAGMVVVMLVVLLLNVFFEVFFEYRFNKTADKKRILLFLGFTAAFAAGYMINPLGPSRFVEMFRVSGLSTTANIPEWHPVTVSGAVAALVIAVLFFATGYGFYASFRGKNVGECRHLAVVCALICLGLMSQKSGMMVILFFMAYGYKYIEVIIDDVLLSGTVL